MDNSAVVLSVDSLVHVLRRHRYACLVGIWLSFGIYGDCFQELLWIQKSEDV